ncbi:MAG: hypothetical protein ACRD3W_28010, partial [Terriglobales bacterium]
MRNALKGALGQQAIPTARKTSQPAVPAAAAAVPPPPPKATPTPTPATADIASPFAQQAAPGGNGAPTISPVQSKSNTGQVTPPVAPAAANPFAAQAAGGSAKSLGSILGASAARGSQEMATPPAPPSEPHKPGDPYADLDFGDFTDFSDPQQQKPKQKQTVSPRDPNDPDSTWGNLQAMPPGQEHQESLTAPPSAPGNAPLGSESSQFDTMPPGQVADLLRAQQAEALTAKQSDEQSPDDDSKWGNLNSIPTPKPSPAAGKAAWGDLDSIPTPKNAAPVGGLSGLMTGKARASSAPAPKFGRTRQVPPQEGQQAADADAAAAAPPPEPIDDATAEARLKEKLAVKSVADEISDYVFATPG